MGVKMLRAVQDLGDRIVGRFVPPVVAEAGVQDYTVLCRCRIEGYFRWAYRKNCANGRCGPCYLAGQGC